MSITFSGAVKPGDSDTQFGLKGAARGQGNAISANFSALLTSISDENANLDASGKILNAHLGDFETGALDKISEQEFKAQIISNDFIKVDNQLDTFSSEQDIDGLVSHLETGGNFDGSALFNATAAFVDSRIGALAAESVVDKSSSGLTLSTFAELFAAVDHFEKSEKINGLENSSSNQNLLDKNNLNILNDLMVGVPIKLELNDMDISSILFDIRDLKNDLEKDILLNSSKLLIPQIVPINIKNANVKNDGYDPFVAVKVDLLDPEGKLGAADFIELPEHPDLEPGFRLVGVTRTVEIDPEVDPRSKLLIGLSIPENTDLKNLPDFVRFRISLEKDSRNVSEQEVMPAHELDEVSKASSAAEVNVISGINSLARQLILSLQEMSGVSSNSAQIVTKTASADVMIPSFDMQRVLAPELNKLLLNQSNENDFFMKDAETNLLEQKNSSNALNPKSFAAESDVISDLGSVDRQPILSLQGMSGVSSNSAQIVTKAASTDVMIPSFDMQRVLAPELNKLLLNQNNENDFFMKDAETNLLEQKNVSNVLNPKSFAAEADVISVIGSVDRQPILSLQGMSGVSSNSAQIVTKTASADVMIPSFDTQRVLASELNKLRLNQNDENLISLEMQSTQNSLAQNRAIFETEVKLVASMGNDVRASVTSSLLALDTELKSFFKVKNNKSDFFMKEVEANLLEQKNVSNVFNPKSFLEAVEVLRMKPISFPASASKANLWMGGQSDVTSFASAKVDNQTPVQSSASSNSNGLASTFNNKISLYDAQYASKMSMLVVDKVLKGQENFEIHLEPESFGKIKVNVLMGRQALDILMVAETQAAASLLRANEESLLQIAGQNGLKLASFSVSMQNGTDQQRQNSNQNRNRVTGQANSVLDRTKIQNSQTSTLYRTPTGLNLIA